LPLSRPIAGEVVGFTLQWEGQMHGMLWITGDTVLYDGVHRVANGDAPSHAAPVARPVACGGPGGACFQGTGRASVR
jgi:hypothetical protein